jgi:signal transduction histidine kinase
VRGIQGTGLGLSIVRRVVESSGGSVSLASLPDHGTSITINLQRTKT